MWFSVCGKIKNELHHVVGLSGTIHSRCFRSSSNMRRFGLYKRISPLGDPQFSVRPILDEWLRDWKSVDKQQLRQLIKELTKYKRFRHALEVSEWMSDRMYFAPSTADLGSRLYLISRVHGLQRAEKYFNNIPDQMKNTVVYTNLLNCYAREMSAEKAEEILQTMKDIGIARGTICYNIMMNMYYQMNALERLDALMLEMEQNGIPCDQFTLSIHLSAYAAASNIEALEKTLERIESTPQMANDWSIYGVAADGYLKVKLIDKAIMMLKKCEELLNEKTGNEAFHMLLKLYSETGRKEDLCHFWFRFKAERNVYNKGYMAMISSALKLDDVELAENIFNQWLSRKLSFDFWIPNLLFHAYCQKGLLEKAELLLQTAEVEGVDPPFDSYYTLASKCLEVNEISKAMKVIERVISKHPTEKKPEEDILCVCFEYLQGKGDRKRLGEFIDSLRMKDIFSMAALERLYDHLSKGLEANASISWFKARNLC